MGEVQLAEIRKETNGTTSNNAYPRFSCNYSFLAPNSFYIIPAKPQETSLNSSQYASESVDATGDPVNSWDPSGLGSSFNSFPSQEANCESLSQSINSALQNSWQIRMRILGIAENVCSSQLTSGFSLGQSIQNAFYSNTGSNLIFLPSSIPSVIRNQLLITRGTLSGTLYISKVFSKLLSNEIGSSSLCSTLNGLQGLIAKLNHGRTLSFNGMSLNGIFTSLKSMQAVFNSGSSHYRDTGDNVTGAFTSAEQNNSCVAVSISRQDILWGSLGFAVSADNSVFCNYLADGVHS